MVKLKVVKLKVVKLKVVKLKVVKPKVVKPKVVKLKVVNLEVVKLELKWLGGNHVCMRDRRGIWEPEHRRRCVIYVKCGLVLAWHDLVV